VRPVCGSIAVTLPALSPAKSTPPASAGLDENAPPVFMRQFAESVPLIATLLLFSRRNCVQFCGEFTETFDASTIAHTAKAEQALPSTTPITRGTT
jgi:hypothetical protein